MFHPILEVRNLNKAFGGLQAIKDVTFKLLPQEIKGLMGPNGAGKSTIIKVITRVYPFDKDGGEVFFSGVPLSRLKSFQIAGLGIAQTFQIVQLFGSMTAVENVMVGFHRKTKSNFFSDLLALPKIRRQEKDIFHDSLEKLSFVGLEKPFEMAGSLPFGEQRLLEIARALASDPKLLLMDEPAAGMNTQEKLKLANLIYKIRDSGVTILIVEHNMDLLLEVSDEILVLDFGQKIIEGSPEDIKKNELVIKAYLGEGYQSC